MKQPEELAEILGIPKKGMPILCRALTHKSYTSNSPLESNERLEFLGDAVLGVVVAELLIERFPSKREGELAKARSQLVCRSSLAEAARRFRLQDFIRLGFAEIANGGRSQESILADGFEALVAALYLTTSMERVRKFVSEMLADGLLLLENKTDWRDSKTRLQEMRHAIGMDPPVYRVSEATGPAHARDYTVEVLLDGEVAGTGDGKSKRDAEIQAATAAIARISVGALSTGPK